MREESNNTEEKEVDNSSNQGLLNYDDNEKQSLFKFFGIELTAPKELKNPRIVYISFIVVNLFLLILLKNFIIH